MPQFRLKPDNIEAYQFLDGQEAPEGVCFEPRCMMGEVKAHVHRDGSNGGFVDKIYYNQWVCVRKKGKKTEYFVLSDADFKLRYKEVKPKTPRRAKSLPVRNQTAIAGVLPPEEVLQLARTRGVVEVGR